MRMYLLPILNNVSSSTVLNWIKHVKLKSTQKATTDYVLTSL